LRIAPLPLGAGSPPVRLDSQVTAAPARNLRPATTERSGRQSGRTRDGELIERSSYLDNYQRSAPTGPIDVRGDGPASAHPTPSRECRHATVPSPRPRPALRTVARSGHR